MTMAKFVLKNPFVSVDGVNLSDHVSSVTIETVFDEVDMTASGAVYKEIAQGLGDATITLAVFQDFAALSVDATLWPLSQSGSTFPVIIRATAAAVSATNPQFTMAGGVLLTYSPIAGAIGAASTTDVTIRNGAPSGLVRTVA
jgi:hypothetical protein